VGPGQRAPNQGRGEGEGGIHHSRFFDDTDGEPKREGDGFAFRVSGESTRIILMLYTLRARVYGAGGARAWGCAAGAAGPCGRWGGVVDGRWHLPENHKIPFNMSIQATAQLLAADAAYFFGASAYLTSLLQEDYVCYPRCFLAIHELTTLKENRKFMCLSHQS